MIKNTEAGAFSSLWPQGICRTCCLGWISDRVVTGNFARVGTECRARSWFCGGRGCRWAWRNRGAGAIKRGKACRDLSFRRGARWPWARPGARAKLAERPLGGARGCGAQAPAQDECWISEAASATSCRTSANWSHLTIWPWSRTHVVFSRAENIFLIKSQMDVQEKRMGNHTIHVSPGSFLKSIVHESEC